VNPVTRNSLRGVALAACLGVACVATAQGLGAFGSATGPPAPTITDAPLRPTIATSATFGFHGLATSFECSMDGSKFRACKSPVTYRGLKRATHTFRVRGHDTSGPAGDPASYTWQIVAPAKKPAPPPAVPRPVMTTVPVKPWVSRIATFAWDRRGAPSSQCSRDDGPWATCVAPKTYSRLALGKHVFRVRGANGSRHSSANSFTWTISAATAPAAPVLSGGPAGQTTDTGATFTFDVTVGMGYECELDGSAWNQCSTPVILVGLAVGQHTFCVRAVGPTGIASPPSCTTWVVNSVQQSPPPPHGTFTISGDLPGNLAPGIGGPVPVTITNPLSFPLTVTHLVVTVAAGSSNAGCSGPANLAVTQSNMSGSAVPVVVPAGGSVTLPDQGATEPVVTMQNLPSNQDACKGATFTLSYAAIGTQ
jgi:hypothetical protein